MSLVYDHNNFNFKYPEGEFKKNQDLMDPYYPNLQQQQQNQLYTTDLDRYQSAPTDFSCDFISGGNDDYRSFRSPSPEMGSFFAEVTKEEEKEHVSEQNGCYVNEPEISSFSDMINADFKNSMHFNPVNDDNHSNLSVLEKQRSSPAGFLSSFMMENRFSAKRDFRDLRDTNEVKGQGNSSVKGVNSHMNLQFLPSASEIGPNSSNDSWKTTSFSFFETTGGTNIRFSGSETQNGRSANKLVHHLSLPTTFSERDTVEKFLHFQGMPVPCKIRAKRGFATHPRSIAERVRRNRISQRMRKLQDLLPEMDKQTNTADMLEMAVAQIKELHKQVEALKETRANCSCSGGKRKQIINE